LDGIFSQSDSLHQLKNLSKLLQMLMMQLLQRKDTTQAADSVLAETGSPPIPAEANSGEVGAIPQMAPEMKNADLNQFRIWINFS